MVTPSKNLTSQGAITPKERWESEFDSIRKANTTEKNQKIKDLFESFKRCYSENSRLKTERVVDKFINLSILNNEWPDDVAESIQKMIKGEIDQAIVHLIITWLHESSSEFSDRRIAATRIYEFLNDPETRQLDLSNLNISSLPQIFMDSRFADLRILNLSKTGLTDIPSSFVVLISLNELDLSHTKIKALPEWLGSLTKLNVLNLSHTKITSLPKSVGNLTALNVLNLSKSPIKSLPRSFHGLTALNTLNLANTKLESLSDSVCCLTKLNRLDLSNTKITYLPENFGDLRELTELWLNNTKITYLRDPIFDLNNKLTIDLTGAPLTEKFLQDLRAATSLDRYNGPKFIDEKLAVEILVNLDNVTGGKRKGDFPSDPETTHTTKRLR